jgi:hypothetical protein
MHEFMLPVMVGWSGVPSFEDFKLVASPTFSRPLVRNSICVTKVQ